MNPLVLYVDDDLANRVVFESSLEGRFRLRTTSNGADALEIMKSDEVAILLTDQRMPGMSGVELMEVTSRQSPDTVRMLITAYSDLNAAIEAINRGQVHYYLRKPWDIRELRLALETAMERYVTSRRLRQLETRLISTERLYALGVIAAEIAHEIRNPLSTIKSNLLLSQGTLLSLHGEAEGEDLDLGKRRKKLSETIEALHDCDIAADAIMEITRSVELTTRSTESETVDMEEVVNLALRALQSDPHRWTALDVQTQKVTSIRGSRTRLGQVVLNLVVNALEAAKPTSERPNRVNVRLWEKHPSIHLEVKDSGSGIDPKVLARIFDPFFTTKDDGGTGLGLAISRRIIEEHGGSIVASSVLGEGTRFLVTLPTASLGP